jgi:hypothetical protein
MLAKVVGRLSGGPLCGGVCGHRKMHQTSTVMAENHEREQKLERDGGHDEEIYGNEVLGVIPEKSLPCLGGRFPVADLYLATAA